MENGAEGIEKTRLGMGGAVGRTIEEWSMVDGYFLTAKAYLV